jgi:hypothetical protein
MVDMQEVFNSIYSKGTWKNNEECPRAGMGSTKNYCKGILPILIKSGYLEERVFVDLGCNDRDNWLPPELTASTGYFGIDIVPDVQPHLVCDLIKIEEWFPKIPPSPRFFFIKDVLHHWPTHVVVSWLEEMRKRMSPQDILLTINGRGQMNRRSQAWATGDRVYKAHYGPLQLGKPPLTEDFGFSVERVMESWKTKTKEALLWQVSE